jgi:protein-histidine pros-kinase
VSEEGQANAAPAAARPERAPVVLVVDDDADQAFLCGFYLRDAGFDVLEATTGSAALALAREHRPAVIVSELGLSDIDGAEVLGELRADETTAGIPVVVLATPVAGRDEAATWDLGVFDYVTKPFEKQHLVDAVRAALVPGKREEAERRRNAALQRLRARDAEAWQRLAAIVESSNDAIIGKSLDGTITSWNAAAEQLYGYPAYEVIGRPISVLAPPDRLDEIPEILARVARGERTEHFETLRRARDGRLVAVSLSVSPIRDASGEVTGAATIAHDLTARRQSDARFRALVETAPDAMVIVDEGGTIELVNRRTELLFGFDRTELVGQVVEALVPAWFRTGHRRLREAFFGAPSPRPMGAGHDLYGLHKDGSEFPVEIYLSPLRTAERTTVTATIRDVTERKRAEALFRGLLESAPDAMVIVDDSGRIRLVNAQTERLFGYAREDLLGQSVEILVPERFGPRHVQHRAVYATKTRARPMGSGLDLRGRRKNGTEFSVEISLSPLDTPDGLLVSAAIRDISERRAVDNARALALQLEREASQKLRELNGLRSDLLSTVSHELRSPLTAIKGLAEILASNWATVPEPQKVDLVERIMRASRRLDHLISDLLDFASLERGQLRVHLESEPVAKLVATALERAASVLETHPVDAVISDDLIVMADPAAFARVLENLLSNAAKFSPPGSEITVSAHPEATGIAITVTDHGPGIPADELDKIFQRFYRVRPSHNRLPGTGVGLAIVKEFTEAQGGWVTVISTVGTGSAFTIHLPSPSSAGKVDGCGNGPKAPESG